MSGSFVTTTSDLFSKKSSIQFNYFFLYYKVAKKAIIYEQNRYLIRKKTQKETNRSFCLFHINFNNFIILSQFQFSLCRYMKKYDHWINSIAFGYDFRRCSRIDVNNFWAWLNWRKITSKYVVVSCSPFIQNLNMIFLKTNNS